MSRSNPNLKNPAKKFFTWHGGENTKGVLSYYDKEQEQEVAMPFPFSFLVLDELNTITGFSKADSSSYWSNEVRNIERDLLTVKTGKGVKGYGLYKNLGEVKALGAKYAKSIYIAFKDEGNLEIGNLRVAGSAISAWINFAKKADVYKEAVALTGATKAKNGTITYYIPIFETQAISAESDRQAKALDAELQAYLYSYFSRPSSEIVEEVESDEPTVSKELKIEEAGRPIEGMEERRPEQDSDTINIKDVPF